MRTNRCFLSEEKITIKKVNLEKLEGIDIHYLPIRFQK